MKLRPLGPQLRAPAPAASRPLPRGAPRQAFFVARGVVAAVASRQMPPEWASKWSSTVVECGCADRSGVTTHQRCPLGCVPARSTSVPAAAQSPARGPIYSSADATPSPAATCAAQLGGGRCSAASSTSTTAMQRSPMPRGQMKYSPLQAVAPWGGHPTLRLPPCHGATLPIDVARGLPRFGATQWATTLGHFVPAARLSEFSLR